MPTAAQPLDTHQQKLVNIVKAAHQNLAVARKTRNAEATRRIAVEQERIKQEAARQMDETAERIRLELDHELVVHEAALDDSLIAAYNSGIPVTRIAIDGFGLRYPGTVQQLIVKLRNEGLVGSSLSSDRGRKDGEPLTVEFPKPINVEGVLNEATTLFAPRFTLQPEPLTLVEPDENGKNGITVESVQIDMDPRDPYFKEISANARPGTEYKHSTSATLYLHPATGELIAHESRETGETFWDHPVARWVKDHKAEAEVGFHDATAQ